MKKSYIQMKKEHQEEVNNFPMIFAFSNKQFEEGMKKLGLKITDTDKIYKLGDTGGYYRKVDAEKLHEMFKRHNYEMKEAMKNEEFAYGAFDYELANHEYVITYSLEDTLNALGLTLEEVHNDKVLNKALNRAKKECVCKELI